MSLTRSKIGLSLSISYLALFALAGLYAIYLLVYHTANSEFCGLPAIVVTLPWSMIMLPFFDAIGFVHWYEKFSGYPAIYGLCAMMMLLPSAMINASFLYFFGRELEKGKR